MKRKRFCVGALVCLGVAASSGAQATSLVAGVTDVTAATTLGTTNASHSNLPWAPTIAHEVERSDSSYGSAALAYASVQGTANDVRVSVSVSTTTVPWVSSGYAYAYAGGSIGDEYRIRSDSLPEGSPVTIHWRALVDQDVGFQNGEGVWGAIALFGTSYEIEGAGSLSRTFEGSIVLGVGNAFMPTAGVFLHATSGTTSVYRPSAPYSAVGDTASGNARLRFEITSTTDGAYLEGYSPPSIPGEGTPTPTPLPPSIVLLGSGLAGLGGLGWTRRKTA